ncbi:hypothetical protein AB1Y20_020547 [Prymnesium parvum]|uniref:Pectin acetylesterase n=1 Tax=Prymnesium parvum TaxID=97485 RepID=A0AB34JXQ8_PRYPA
MTLHLIGQELSQQLGAYCLDGSRPGYWYDPPTPRAAHAASNRSWLVFLDGGAWCYDAQDCDSRSRGFRGSSRAFPARYWPYSGPLDKSVAVNPTFAGFHRVLLGYCDGSSFTGERVTPYALGSGAVLHMRGRAVLHALLLHLMRAGMREARQVLFSGGSAGGLGTVFAANWLQAQLPAAKLKVLLVSSFFLHLPAGDAPTCTRGRGAQSKCLPWAVKMQQMCALHNCTPTVRAAGVACDAAGAGAECLLPAASLRSVRPPTFVINSAIDSWQACREGEARGGAVRRLMGVVRASSQLVNVWRRYYRCRYDGTPACSTQQVAHAVRETNGMIGRFVDAVHVSGATSRPGHGAFITSCNEHVAGVSADGFMHYSIDNQTLRDALARWWASDSNSPASEHTRLPCTLTHKSSPDSPNHQCNPSCLRVKMKRRLNQECPCDPGK